MIAGVKMPGIGARSFCILSDFREQNFCGPCGPCFWNTYFCAICRFANLQVKIISSAIYTILQYFQGNMESTKDDKLFLYQFS